MERRLNGRENREFGTVPSMVMAVSFHRRRRSGGMDGEGGSSSAGAATLLLVTRLKVRGPLQRARRLSGVPCTAAWTHVVRDAVSCSVPVMASIQGGDEPGVEGVKRR